MSVFCIINMCFMRLFGKVVQVKKEEPYICYTQSGVFLLAVVINSSVLACCIVALLEDRTHDRVYAGNEGGIDGYDGWIYPSTHYIISTVAVSLSWLGLLLWLIYLLAKDYCELVIYIQCFSLWAMRLAVFVSAGIFFSGIDVCKCFGEEGIRGALMTTAVVTCLGGPLLLLLNLLQLYTCFKYMDYNDYDEQRERTICCCCDWLCCCIIERGRRKRKPFYKPGTENRVATIA